MSENEFLEGSKEQPVPEPVRKATVSEEHTAENTTVKDRKEPVGVFKRILTEEERTSGSALKIFLGNSKADIVNARDLIRRWLAVTNTRELFGEDLAEESQLAAAEATWSEYVEKEHPGRTKDEMEALAVDVYNYISEIQDEVKIPAKMLREENISNVHDRGGFITGDIVGQVPGKNIDIQLRRSERMRRAAASSNDDKLKWDVLLRDSYIKVNFERPNRTLAGGLINDIRRTIVGYVRRVNHNSAVIAQMAATQAIWNFMVKYIRSCSVSDITDFSDLINHISVTDFETLVNALLESFNTQGVNLHLRCLNMKCDWSEFGLVDPSTLTQVRWDIIDAAEGALLNNIFNGRVKLTAAECDEYRRKSTYGLESNRVYNADKTMYLTIAPPTLAEAFGAFEYFISQVNAEISDIRSKVVDPKEFDAQVGLVYANMGATEYIHWVASYTRLGAPGSGEPDEVFNRWDEDVDKGEFDEGVYGIILDHDDLNTGLTKFVLNKTPFMSRTFTGIQNYTCPKCQQNSGDHLDPHKTLDHVRGYTPINAIMSFFILTQVTILKRASDGHEFMKKVHSDLLK